MTNALYAMIETYFPEDMRYRVRGAISEDLGQRSLFLLLLTASVELMASTACSISANDGVRRARTDAAAGRFESSERLRW